MSEAASLEGERQKKQRKSTNSREARTWDVGRISQYSFTSSKKTHTSDSKKGVLATAWARESSNSGLCHPSNVGAIRDWCLWDEVGVLGSHRRHHPAPTYTIHLSANHIPENETTDQAAQRPRVCTACQQASRRSLWPLWGIWPCLPQVLKDKADGKQEWAAESVTPGVSEFHHKSARGREIMPRDMNTHNRMPQLTSMYFSASPPEPLDITSSHTERPS